MKTNTLTTEKVKANKKIIIVVAIIVAAVGTSLILLSKAAPPAVGFYFNPQTSSQKTGTQFNVQVMGSTTIPVQAMTVLVKYDPTVLRLDDTQATTGIDGTWQTKAGCGPSDQVPVAPYGPSDFAPCRPAGEAYFVVANNLPSNLHPAGNNLVVGNLKFTVLKVPTGGVTTLSIDTSLGNTKMTNSVTSGAQTTLDARQVVDSTYTITDGIAPTNPVTGLTSPSKTMNSVNLAWNSTVDDANGSGIASYKVYRSSTGVASALVGTVSAIPISSTYSFSDKTGLTPSTSYTYTVQAVDGGGNVSPMSLALSTVTLADTQAPTTPGAPTIGPGTAGMNSIPLTWTASTDNVGVKNYIVKRNGVQIATPTAYTYVDSSTQALAPGTSYTYTVQAVDNAGNLSGTAQSSLSTAADTQAPTSPGGLSANYPSANKVSLSWTASTDNVGVSSYTVSRNGTILSTVAGNVTSYADPTVLTPGSYTYTVSAKDQAGNVSPNASVIGKINATEDYNKDSKIDTVDLIILLSNMGKSGSGLVGDINGDSKVDTTDLVILLSKFGVVN